MPAVPTRTKLAWLNGLRKDIHDALVAWALQGGEEADFGDWKAFWQDSELALYVVSIGPRSQRKPPRQVAPRLDRRPFTRASRRNCGSRLHTASMLVRASPVSQSLPLFRHQEYGQPRSQRAEGVREHPLQHGTI